MTNLNYVFFAPFSWRSSGNKPAADGVDVRQATAVIGHQGPSSTALILSSLHVLLLCMRSKRER